MSALALACGLLLFGQFLAPQPVAAKEKARPAGEQHFLSNEPFSYQMSLEDAEKLVSDPEKWKVVFRIDTTSTTDLAVVYQRQFFWRISFYRGSLYAIEKRGEVEPELVEATFKAMGEKFGESREATRSEDGDLVYSRWRLDNLEVALTASREPDGRYRITYEEADRDMLSTARRKQEQELQAAPGDIDPITGKPRLSKPAKDKDQGSKDKLKGKAKQKNKKNDSAKDKDAKDKDAKDKDKDKDSDQKKDEESEDTPPAED
ncbi:hypothetical protein IT575_04830 [bacterium]|nr:hypothetical protein [bacterium]